MEYLPSSEVDVHLRSVVGETSHEAGNGDAAELEDIHLPAGRGEEVLAL